jgi:hypothetical protein
VAGSRRRRRQTGNGEVRPGASGRRQAPKRQVRARRQGRSGPGLGGAQASHGSALVRDRLEISRSDSTRAVAGGSYQDRGDHPARFRFHHGGFAAVEAGAHDTNAATDGEAGAAANCFKVDRREVWSDGRRFGSRDHARRSAARASHRIGHLALAHALVRPFRACRVLWRAGLMSRSRRAGLCAWRHVRLPDLRPALSGRLHGRGERRGRRCREASHPGALDFLDSVGLDDSPLALTS